MLFKRLIPAIAALAALATPIAAQVPRALNPAQPAPTAVAPLPANPPTTPALTKTDVDAWLDGFVPYALKNGDIAGAVVVVVKDGQVLTERSFGYADVKKQTPIDPKTTLFRPGSISKLFTWTAVMQLVQAGKINLDADINTYLDFKIPPAFGKPITMRDLMTHRPGFEESVKYLISEDQKHVTPLDKALKRWVPARVYAPGTIPAYSNYGASLAGYIVQRVSGQPFDDYIEQHIFQPLGMAHSSFRQPLPPTLAPHLSDGYQLASQDPHPYEIIPLSPAGALAATGDDMAKFMIAQLNQGGPLLAPQTAQYMHKVNDTPIPGMPGMALGFYHEDRNGLNIIGHGGDTDWFHSDLHLYLDKHVGFFISLNSLGKDGNAHVVLDRTFAGFTDRYFPHPTPPLPTAPTAHEHGLAMAGNYISSRGSYTDWVRAIAFLSNIKVTLNSDDTISVSGLTTPAGVIKKWREVAPWQWQEVGGDDRLGAAVKDGKVTAIAPAGFAPIFVFLPAPWNLNAAWMMPLMILALAIMLLTALTWPIRAIVRRRYGYQSSVAGRRLWLNRATQATAWIMLAVPFGWMMMIQLLGADVGNLDGRLDGWMRILQLLSLVGIAGTAATLWNLYESTRQPRRPILSIVWLVLVALAAVYLVWLMLTLRTITPSLNY
ncbi:serine hydrolase domain-containing protein [Hephaestia mangrovi]|uniref:serine hydrolase domain-containing protein n=1 Tax=Hephaestia mangrovi TaxID=2873268 RepID=UPI001CA73D2A|nr:serine hydrolase domain-containing protein [Hephaestia mangrovi]MBY8829449.1 beta-lactamase family protein [Hephaestia mangrovi]